MLKLVKPSYKYRKSFLNEFKKYKKGEAHGVSHADLAYENFKKFLDMIQNHETGTNLPRGLVSASTYWLVDEKGFAGGVSFRHKLNKKLREHGGHIGYSIVPNKRKKGYGTKALALTLKKAKRIGLKKVMVTCNEDNIPSRKVIQKNGGILEDIIKTKYNLDNKPTMRWWIHL